MKKLLMTNEELQTAINELTAVRQTREQTEALHSLLKIQVERAKAFTYDPDDWIEPEKEETP